MGNQPDTSKYAVIYPRQSTGEQVKENIYSLERQLRLKDLAIRHGFAEEYVLVLDEDLGVSGRRIDLRAGFTRALKMIEQGVVGAIYVEDLTRLSRDERTIDQMIIADACERSGTLIYMGGSWYDMCDPAQRMSYKYQAVGLSESWKAHLQKLHGAQRDKARQGKVASRALSYGYRVNRDVPRRHPDRDKLVIYEPEAAIIRAVVAKLFEAGSIRELYRQIHPTYWPNGKLLNYRMLNNILTNPIYRGHYHWGGEFVEFAHEPIIPPDVAAEIDRLRSLNKATKRGESEAAGVLVGLIYCPECRRRLYGNRSRTRPDYRCGRNHPYETTDGPRFHFCVSMNVIDRVVMADLWRRMDDGLIDQIVGQLESERQAQANVVDLSEGSRKALQRKIDGLSKSLSDPDVTESVRKILLQQLDQTAKELDAIEQSRPYNPHLAYDIDFYEDLKKKPSFLASLPLTWDDEPVQWRRSWIRRFIERVEVSNPSRGCYDVTIHYLNGHREVLRHYTKPGVTEGELEVLRVLWNDPDRPSYGWGKWMIERLKAHGYHRCPAGIRRAVAIALGRKVK
ncbi:MAG: recombinase family protein [Candidatus Sericytochromatia bacterium]